MKTLYIHPDNPQPRLMNDVISAIKSGGIVILPTESGYRFGFGMNAKEAFERLKRLGVAEDDLTLICQNISHLSKMAMVTNEVFSQLKQDFLPLNRIILMPTKAVNKKIIGKKSLAFSTSATPIVTTLLEQLDEAIFVSPLLYQGDRVSEYPDITDKLDTHVDVFVDVGVVDEVDVATMDLTQ